MTAFMKPGDNHYDGDKFYSSLLINLFLFCAGVAFIFIDQI
jgi:hypothetical protein